ncbi:MAG: DUF1566 domain-containing protein [Chlorobiaceae bacterium]
MKLHAKVPFTRLWLMLLLAGVSMFTVSALSSAAAPQIGDSYGGGVVLYVDGTGQHGLIAAKTDVTLNISGKEKGFFNWYGARVAANAFVEGYSDWFLPNKEQLLQIYSHRFALVGIESTYYWSSSESDATKAWAEDFTTGKQLDGNKTNTGRVRPVRYF